MTSNRQKRPEDVVEELLKKLLITQLALARVPQGEIAKLLGKNLDTYSITDKLGEFADPGEG